MQLKIISQNEKFANPLLDKYTGLCIVVQISKHRQALNGISIRNNS